MRAIAQFAKTLVQVVRHVRHFTNAKRDRNMKTAGMNVAMAIQRIINVHLHSMSTSRVEHAN